MADAGVHEPPKSASRGLIVWAIDLWPYVHGKSIVQGIHLAEMEASDMLDVLHYYFEEDTTYITQEHALYTDTRRKSLYRLFYETEYKYGSVSEGSTKSYTTDSGEEFTSKSYVPPTEFNPESGKPFGEILDAPLG